MKNVLILGAGFGGLTAANLLAKHCNVTLIDRNSTYCMSLNKLWVMAGKRSPQEYEKPYFLLKKKKINFIKTEIAAIDLERKIVETSERGFSYDYLIIGMGAEPVPQVIPGFDNAYNLYTMQGAQQINNALRRIERGKIAILICRTPFKCPAAPYEAAFLIEEYLRKMKTRNNIEISVYTPEPQPMPVAGKVIGEKIKQLLSEKGISYLPNYKIIEIGKNSLKFENGENKDCDLIIGIPPHSAPAAIKHLCDENFISVDKKLQTKFNNVFAIGDCTAIKLADGKLLPKAGVLAEEEAKVVAHNIIAEINGTEKISFNGKGYCFVETGDGKAAYADGDFFVEPSANVVMQEPSEKFLLEKVEFEKKRLKEWF